MSTLRIHPFKRWAVRLGLLCLFSCLGCSKPSTPPTPPSVEPKPAEPKSAEKPAQEVPAKGEVRVAAASDLKFALDELIAEFRRIHPEITVSPTYGSSGNFYAQLTNKAPFDIFLSADIEYPRNLIEAALGDKDSEFQYAR